MPEVAGKWLRHWRLCSRVELHDPVAADRVERFCVRIEREPGRLRHGIRLGDPAGGLVDRDDLVLPIERSIDRIAADGQRHEIRAQIGRAVIARLHLLAVQWSMRFFLGKFLRPLRDEQLVFAAAEARPAAGLRVERVDAAAIRLVRFFVAAVHRHVDHARGGVVGQRRVDAVEHAPVEIAAPDLAALGVHALDAAAQFVHGPEQVDVAGVVCRGTDRAAMVAAHAAAAVFRRPWGRAAVVHAGDKPRREPGVGERADRVAARRHRLPVVVEAVPDLRLLAGRPFGPRQQGADDLAIGTSGFSSRGRDGEAHIALGRVRVAERNAYRRRGGDRRRPELLFVRLLLRERRRHRPRLDKMPAAPGCGSLIGKPGGTDQVIETVPEVVDAAARPVALHRHHPVAARLRRRGHVQKLPGNSPFHRRAPLRGRKSKQALIAGEHLLILEVPAVGNVGGGQFRVGVLPERHVDDAAVLLRIFLNVGAEHARADPRVGDEADLKRIARPALVGLADGIDAVDERGVVGESHRQQDPLVVIGGSHLHRIPRLVVEVGGHRHEGGGIPVGEVAIDGDRVARRRHGPGRKDVETIVPEGGHLGLRGSQRKNHGRKAEDGAIK